MFVTQLYEASLGSNIDSEDMGYARLPCMH